MNNVPSTATQQTKWKVRMHVVVRKFFLQTHSWTTGNILYFVLFFFGSLCVGQVV